MESMAGKPKAGSRKKGGKRKPVKSLGKKIKLERELERAAKSARKSRDKSHETRKLVLDIVEGLKKAEAQWKMQSIIIEDDKKLLRECEEKIADGISELKKASRTLSLHEKLPYEMHFVLKDGKRLASLAELMDALKSVEKGIFESHINAERNDFAQWIRDTSKDESLVSLAESSKSAEQLFSSLEKWLGDYERALLPDSLVPESLKKIAKKTKGDDVGNSISLSKRLDREIGPEKFFILHSGRAIKSLAELERELRIADDSTFGYHVGNGKNDFADWIRDVWDDKGLAEQVRPINDRKELVEFLSIFM